MTQAWKWNAPHNKQLEDMLTRVIVSAVKWEHARAATLLHDAAEPEFAKYHRAAERLATAVRVYRRKHG